MGPRFRSRVDRAAGLLVSGALAISASPVLPAARAAGPTHDFVAIVRDGIPAGSWRRSAGGWWYGLDASAGAWWGAYLNNGVFELGGRSYWFDEAGWMRTGWKRAGDYWYYFGADGSAASGWRRLGGRWYFFHESEHWARTGTVDGEGGQCFFTSSGAVYYLDRGDCHMLSGEWLPEDYGEGLSRRDWRYFGPDGTMARGWREVGGSWYWFGDDGVMATGEVVVAGQRHYFDDDGAWMETTELANPEGREFSSFAGWVEDGGGRRYRKDDGTYAAHEVLVCLRDDVREGAREVAVFGRDGYLLRMYRV